MPKAMTPGPFVTPHSSRDVLLQGKDKSTPRSLPRICKMQSRSSLSEVLLLRGEEEPWVTERLRACFRHSYQEVMAPRQGRQGVFVACEARLEGLERVFLTEDETGEPGEARGTWWCEVLKQLD